MEEKEIMDKAKVLAEKSMVTSKRLALFIRGKKGERWAKKMAGLTEWASLPNPPSTMLIAGVVEQELTKDDLLIATSILIQERARIIANKPPANDISIY